MSWSSRNINIRESPLGAEDHVGHSAALLRHRQQSLPSFEPLFGYTQDLSTPTSHNQQRNASRDRRPPRCNARRLSYTPPAVVTPPRLTPQSSVTSQSTAESLYGYRDQSQRSLDTFASVTPHRLPPSSRRNATSTTRFTATRRRSLYVPSSTPNTSYRSSTPVLTTLDPPDLASTANGDPASHLRIRPFASRDLAEVKDTGNRRVGLTRCESLMEKRTTPPRLQVTI